MRIAFGSLRKNRWICGETGNLRFALLTSVIPQLDRRSVLTIETTRATGSGGAGRHGGGFALKAPGIVIGYLSELDSRNSDRSSAVTAPMANENLNVAKKKLCRPSSVRHQEY